MNAYDMLQDVRSNINESTARHWTDGEILQKLNYAQRKIAMMVSMQPGNWLISSVAVTPSDGTITLPSNCAKPLYLEETSSGTPVFFKTTVQDRRTSRLVGVQTSFDTGSLEVYPQLDSIVVNESGYATACTLWYQIRVPDLHQGTAAGGGSTYIQLASGAKPLNDYYNDSMIEIVSGTGSHTIDTITDYAKTNLQATVSGTYGSDSVYGTISRLPEEAHPLIVMEGTCLVLIKSSGSLDQKVYGEFRDETKLLWQSTTEWFSSRIPGAGRHTRITDIYD
jgi:hypothetical protein